MGEGTARESLERQLAAGAGSLSRQGGEGAVGRGSGETEEGDAELAAWLGRPANALVSLGERSHPVSLTLPRTIAPTRDPQVSGPLPPHPQTRRVLTVPICTEGNFLRPSDGSRPLQPPRAAGTLRPGIVRAGPPLPPSLSGSASSPHSPPGQWRTPRDQPEGAGLEGVRASPAFFLQRTLYMVVRGRETLVLVPRLLRRRFLRCAPLPHAPRPLQPGCRCPQGEPAVAAPN